jgi:hypothetical protein
LLLGTGMGIGGMGAGGLGAPLGFGGRADTAPARAAVARTNWVSCTMLKTC